MFIHRHFSFAFKKFLIVFSSLLLISCNIGTGGKQPSQSIEVAAVGAYGAAFSDDAKYAAIGSINHGGSLWRIRDKERLYNWNHHQEDYTGIIAADFSPEGDWAITADEHTMVLWKMSDGSAHRFWTTPGSVLSLSLSTNGNYALLGLSDNTAVIFDVKRGGIRRTFHHDAPVTTVDLSNDNQFALTGSEDFTAVLWNIETSKPVHTIEHEEEVVKVAISPDGKRALSAARFDRAVVWNTANGSITGELPLAKEKFKRGLRFTAAKFSDDGLYLLTGLPDRVVQLWNAKELKEVAKWTLPKRDQWKPSSTTVLAVGFSERKGNYYAIASNGFIHQLKRSDTK